MEYRKTRFGKDFNALQIAQRYYRLEYSSSRDKCVLMTGADITTEFVAPFTFALQDIVIYHMATGYTASTDALEVTCRRPEVDGIPYMIEDYLYKKVISAKNIFSFRKLQEGGLVFEAGKHQLIFNSTSTDLLGIVIYVKRVD